MDCSFFNLLNPECISASIVNSTNVPKEVSSFGQRTVQEYELDYIAWGNGVIINDNVEYPARNGSLFFRKPGMQVEGVLPYECYYVLLNLTDNVNGIDIPEDFPDVIMFDNTTEIEELFKKLYFEYISHRDISSFVMKTYLMQIFFIMYNQWTFSEQLRSREKPNNNYSDIEKVADIIKENFSYNFTLEELAGYSKYSKYTFCRLFKKVTGDTPITYINRYRMYKARRMLLETNMSVKEILYSCGFKNESHFFNMFYKMVGCKPSEYRDKGRLWPQ